jgi:hypothetical protein
MVQLDQRGLDVAASEIFARTTEADRESVLADRRTDARIRDRLLAEIERRHGALFTRRWSGALG